jgi:hypothetical protein
VGFAEYYLCREGSVHDHENREALGSHPTEVAVLCAWFVGTPLEGSMFGTSARLIVAVACAAAVLTAAAAEHKSTFFEEVKITVNDRARADGYLRVRVQPENDVAFEATIDVLKRMSENDIAKGIATALEPVIRPNYEVDKDNGEHVKIRKANGDVANFAVEIAFSAPGFSIILDN